MSTIKMLYLDHVITSLLANGVIDKETAAELEDAAQEALSEAFDLGHMIAIRAMEKAIIEVKSG